ncbi:hypothetical protein BAUCODRAFT_29663 [Baudoinia panamericana UAMH 10762]|uniref:Uncharacterized protein n=1 Tax=Baudoinia panamericana (strain UAMH 10762) TaxID=717646 RepID=M2MW59_BAUPA|nr:uncharacterized protein BAUCODRAFT_29663 [Baudoinia panamericana UAMH 10762]EMD01222.1 hypothetical protein BAUCODRAFT_29663 [Baudoinia panamericana UAMH 10762]
MPHHQSAHHHSGEYENEHEQMGQQQHGHQESHQQDGHQQSSHKKHYGGRTKAKGIENYSVWKGTPISYVAQTLQQDRSPHINLKFSDGSKDHEANINVASTDADPDLVYWLHRQWHHPITKGLTSLQDGVHKITASEPGSGLSLDFLRTKPALLTLSAGRVLPNNKSGPNNDILDQLKPILDDAIQAKAKVYIFGADYGQGIDDVHMNQGSSPEYANAVGEDGAIIFHYQGGDDHYEAVFLAFASQSVPTNDQTGAAEQGGQELAQIAQGTGSQGGSSSHQQGGS